MDRLWTPWRYQYITGASSPDECVFCAKLNAHRDLENYIVLRAARNAIVLNLYPYTNGHLMVVPYEHVPTLEEAAPETLTEMIRLTRDAEEILRKVYKPEGINLGMNIGRCAGAGVAEHIHMHVLPRWTGDANFMSTIGETRVLPEDLPTTYRRLYAAFHEEEP